MNLAKRTMDVLFATAGLMVLWPIFLIVALLIKWDDKGVVFFRQERVGKNGKLFRIFKFRTMSAKQEPDGKLFTVTGDKRITRVGRTLRKLKLDELPQILNVLKGEMTLVGPRPEVPQFVEHYTLAQRKVLDLVPGITAPSSIRFRHESDLLARAGNPDKVYVEELIPEKIRLDLEYAKSANVWSDLKVILQTFRCLAQG